MVDLVDDFGNNLGCARSAADDSHLFSREVDGTVPARGVPVLPLELVQAWGVSKLGSVERADRMDEDIGCPFFHRSVLLAFRFDTPDELVFIPSTFGHECAKLNRSLELILMGHANVEVEYLFPRGVVGVVLWVFFNMDSKTG